MKDKPYILIVDDDPNIAHLVQLYLEKEGFDVKVAQRGDDALNEFRKLPPDLMLLDLMLPGVDGWQVLKTVRKTSTIPVIMLTAKDETFDKVLGLELGADDYVTKPFSAAEFLARIRSALRNRRYDDQDGAVGDTFDVADLHIDFSRRQITRSGSEVRLTQTEYNIVSALAHHAGQVMTYSAIIRAVWGSTDEGSIKKLQVNLANIRKKLGERPGDRRYISNELGVGYRMMSNE